MVGSSAPLEIRVHAPTNSANWLDVVLVERTGGDQAPQIESDELAAVALCDTLRRYRMTAKRVEI